GALEPGERGHRKDPIPVEAGARVDLATGRDVLVADGVAQAVAPAQDGDGRREAGVLALGEAVALVADELDADREVVAARPAEQARCAGMPGAVVAGDELHQLSPPPDQQVRGHAHALEVGEGRMRPQVEPVAEERLDAAQAEAPGRQADEMDDDGVDRYGRPAVVVRRRAATGAGEPAWRLRIEPARA